LLLLGGPRNTFLLGCGRSFVLLLVVVRILIGVIFGILIGVIFGILIGVIFGVIFGVIIGFTIIFTFESALKIHGISYVVNIFQVFLRLYFV
jgi:hypothetical protein